MKAILIAILFTLAASCGQTPSNLSAIDRGPHEMSGPSEPGWRRMDGPEGHGRDGSRADSKKGPSGVSVEGSSPNEREFSSSDFRPPDYRIAENFRMENHRSLGGGINFGDRFRFGGPMRSDPNRGTSRGVGWFGRSGKPNTANGEPEPGTSAGNPGNSGNENHEPGTGAHNAPHADRDQGTHEFRETYRSIDKFAEDVTQKESQIDAQFKKIDNYASKAKFDVNSVAEAVNNSHNAFVKQASSRYPGLNNSLTPGGTKQLTPYHTPAGKQVAAAKAYASYVETQPLPENLTPEMKRSLIISALDAITIADRLFAGGKRRQGESALSAALMALDMTLDFLPFISFAKDSASLALGYNIVTGDTLSSLEKGMLVATLFAPSFITGAKKAMSAIIDAAKGLKSPFARNLVEGTTAYLKGTRYGPLKEGPLHRTKKGVYIADTFRGGSYTEHLLEKPITLYRAYSDPANMIGPYWTRVKPQGPTQMQIDAALNPEWGNEATKVVSIRVPAGTTIYHGAAAGQPITTESKNALGHLLGGGDQIYIDQYVPKAWIVE